LFLVIDLLFIYFALIDKNDPKKGNKDIQNSKSMFNGISKIFGVGKILQSEWSFAQIKVPSDYKSIVIKFISKTYILPILLRINFIHLFLILFVFF